MSSGIYNKTHDLLWITINNRETILNNSTLALLIFCLSGLLLASLLHVALEHQEWQGFWVSAGHILLTSLASFFLLRRPPTQGRNDV